MSRATACTQPRKGRGLPAPQRLTARSDVRNLLGAGQRATGHASCVCSAQTCQHGSCAASGVSGSHAPQAECSMIARHNRGSRSARHKRIRSGLARQDELRAISPALTPARGLFLEPHAARPERRVAHDTCVGQLQWPAAVPCPPPAMQRLPPHRATHTHVAMQCCKAAADTPTENSARDLPAEAALSRPPKAESPAARSRLPISEARRRGPVEMHNDR
jgi:hypothetical protein